MLNPATAVLIFVISGISSVVGKVVYDVANKVGQEITLKDLAPMPPGQGPPIPKLLYTKPGMLSKLLKE